MRYKMLVICLFGNFFFCACINTSSSVVMSNGEQYCFSSRQDFHSFMQQHVHPQKKLVLYVNGKGPEPIRSQISVIPYIEKNYDVQVCMFCWPSFSWVIGYPLESAKQSGEDLAVCLREINAYLIKHNRKCTLFAHSMGNIVVQSFIEKYDGSLRGDLFDNIILNAADTHFANHTQWLKKINFGKRIYVTYSNCDRVLRLSQIFKNRGKLRLGQRGFAKNSPAIYVDFTKNTGIYHEYFRGPSPRRKLAIRDFFYDAFHGEKVSMHHFKAKGKNHYSLF
ncbi:alpha/beta hydrolase [Candidatus Uabimicrobium amorphum]|uniref:Alpha/beta hydrolase n=1 Tax=Uabimicrobium amorphum TaxID=2596890 RepID=A0A5S9ILZ4_UABAM|nr:alpha/beta hydrolase [Candidatus Uabimicrobium amorphum]BBM83490.1 hypothetical protein UABAM_01842 [Candidatus Uabimicrobium amorphum]